jgi:hypothetical protein
LKLHQVRRQGSDYKRRETVGNPVPGETLCTETSHKQVESVRCSSQ